MEKDTRHPALDLHMHVHMQSPAHSHVCPVEHTHTNRGKRILSLGPSWATQQDSASQQNNNTGKKASSLGYWLYSHRHN